MMKNSTSTTEFVNHIKSTLPSHPTHGLRLQDGTYYLVVYVVDTGWVSIILNKEPIDGCIHVDAEVMPLNEKEGNEYCAQYGLSYHENLFAEKQPDDLLQELIDSIYFSSNLN